MNKRNYLRKSLAIEYGVEKYLQVSRKKNVSREFHEI